MMNMTLDDLIAHLTNMRTNGTPGTTPVARYSHSSVFAIDAHEIRIKAVSKPDVEGRRKQLRPVSRKGVDVIVLG
jgi:hypothetical protein